VKPTGEGIGEGGEEALLGRIVEGGAQHPRAEGPQRSDCPLGVAGVADDSE
jgi:hypothetical protein